MYKRRTFLSNLFNRVVNLCKQRTYILGIETSCDDTGAAIVDLKGNLLSECVNSQTKISSRVGGIIPTVAYQMHLHNINPTVQKVLDNINLSFKDLSAIAVTVKPGLPLSLGVGRNYAVKHATENNLPIIPIHHMEAHALTARMFDKTIEFPFMIFLISGGNCIIGLAHDLENFSMLGNRCDLSPGDCLEKIARFLRLIGNSGSHTEIAGGRAIELMANENKDQLIDFTAFRSDKSDCNFSFSGLQGAVVGYLKGYMIDGSIGTCININQLCASILYSMAFQMCRKLQRAMMYCHRYVDSTPSTLVVSGGVASNLYFRECFKRVCDQFDYRLICPPIKYCTDNGAMIAWNGFELFRASKRIISDVNSIDYCGRAPLGVDRNQDIVNKVLGLPPLKIRDLFIK